ncbi:(E)-4-hydroxy-3-methylbut-2-enyl-diphosphate synthase [Geofilum rubicundum]|uniref:4-hydroxy-3-methylbut-2-en-1-yl diphosphate synthase (flavodoxin) n=1 Tax=Geofilum rubicundum JCM 15548 TaxID=1236989 RepID=A0A0E9LWE9_9BACT|nr:(E)-4-hydroxy-3-methylbut-2-enyl-diphosphate synthase [Geofilum rubicundum]GAO29200.1 1-hydroxy-2-methyl-2-(E)-butenyl 4-diphosphate synthase [Geofilum rubicundum JCM 15548]
MTQKKPSETGDATKRSPLFCDSLFAYKRNITRAVQVGTIGIGGSHPVRLQSMTTTNSLETEATAEQCLRIARAGGELVRITTQGRREALNLEAIQQYIRHKGYDFPLVADIHFNPNAALLAAERVDKVRINPGNFADGAKKFRDIDYSADVYQAELADIESKLGPFLEVCRKNGTALRIGANHGSLSDRIMARYGDTPKGMVESCMEFLRICRRANFDNIVLSIKSSNTRVMVHTVRLLVATMRSEGMHYPLHLGVTEAGSGEDGRIKSAVGIGALLADGLGDTIRVSLTEDPEEEIPVARLLRDHVTGRPGHALIEEVSAESYQPYAYVKRSSHQVGIFGKGQPAAVVMDVRQGTAFENSQLVPEAVLVSSVDVSLPSAFSNCIRLVPRQYMPDRPVADVWPLLDVRSFLSDVRVEGHKVLEVRYSDLDAALLGALRKDEDVVLLLTSDHVNALAEQRAFFLALEENGLTHPVIVHRRYSDADLAHVQIKAAADTGLLFLDGYGDGISVAAPKLAIAGLVELHFGILQASRVRFSRTEFISCPGCGRTLFDLQTTTKKVRERTAHLKGLKIAIMGCIVNGIGEMADADYGYVGAGPGKISLFKNRALVMKALPEKEAVDRLIELIKDSGDWTEAPPLSNIF